jgi:hypothetical protein
MMDVRHMPLKHIPQLPGVAFPPAAVPFQCPVPDGPWQTADCDAKIQSATRHVPLPR